MGRLGSAGQAEVRDPRAYLVRIVSRLALNRLRKLARSKEDYVGEWLPEPLLTTPDVAEDVELAESVSIAMLTVLETLTPTERAVFVLREVFELPFEEIAAATGKSAAAVRQIAHRARSHRGRPAAADAVDRGRADAGGGSLPGGAADRRPAGPDGTLAPDAVLVADGGGFAAAALAPIHGADLVAKVLAHASRRHSRRPPCGSTPPLGP